MPLSKETLVNAAKVYFRDGLQATLGEEYWRSISREEVHDVAEKALAYARKQMDDIPLSLEIDDHCIHWLAILTLEDGTEIEIPFNRTDPSETHMLAPVNFLKEIIKYSCSVQPTRHQSPFTVREVEREVIRCIECCDGCSGNIKVRDVVMRERNVYFTFDVCFATISEDELDCNWIGFEVEWPPV